MKIAAPGGPSRSRQRLARSGLAVVLATACALGAATFSSPALGRDDGLIPDASAVRRTSGHVDER